MAGRGPWHVLHFVGHGGVDAATGEGYLALAEADEPVARRRRPGAGGGGVYRLYADDLGRLLAGHYPLRLAVLNACEGAQGDGRDVFAGTAATLIRRGLPAVVAMQFPITDRAAIEFARAFYRAVAAALPVDAAVAAARQAMLLAARGSLEWATPVLFLRAPDAVLFDLAAAPAAAADQHDKAQAARAAEADGPTRTEPLPAQPLPVPSPPGPPPTSASGTAAPRRPQPPSWLRRNTISYGSGPVLPDLLCFPIYTCIDRKPPPIGSD